MKNSKKKSFVKQVIGALRVKSSIKAGSNCSNPKVACGVGGPIASMAAP